MQHFADFGIVKQANKQLKRLNEAKQAPSYLMPNRSGLGQEAQHYADPKTFGDTLPFYSRAGAAKRKNNTRVEVSRQLKLDKDNSDSLLDPYVKPYEKVSLVAKKQTNPEWSDVRKVNDSAASKSGYLGFRTDPYKGYGGMMEEAIPDNELIKVNRLKRNVKPKLLDGLYDNSVNDFIYD